MAAFDYAALHTALKDTLRSELSDVHVSGSGQTPTMDQCPAVQVRAGSFTRTPVRITAGMANSGADEALRVRLRCWAFSAESEADADRQRDALLARVETVINANVQLGGTQALWVDGGDFDTLVEDGFFSVVDLSLRTLAFS